MYINIQIFMYIYKSTYIYIYTYNHTHIYMFIYLSVYETHQKFRSRAEAFSDLWQFEMKAQGLPSTINQPSIYTNIYTYIYTYIYIYILYIYTYICDTHQGFRSRAKAFSGLWPVEGKARGHPGTNSQK